MFLRVKVWLLSCDLSVKLFPPPFEIKHTTSDINSLVELINSVEGESRIVMEHTGHYYEVLAHQLSEANLFVSTINPKLIKDFDNDFLRKAKFIFIFYQKIQYFYISC